jgi:hypothetical protein
LIGRLDQFLSAAAQVEDVDLDSAALLLHIYCIYDSDMTHGGLRYPSGFGGVKSQCYLGYSYLSFFFCNEGLLKWIERSVLPASAAPLRARPKTIYQHAHSFPWELPKDDGKDAELSSGLDMFTLKSVLSLVALYNLGFRAEKCLRLY